MLCQSKWKTRSVDTTNNHHIPQLQKYPNPDIVFIGDSMFERFIYAPEAKPAWRDNGLNKLNIFNCSVGGDKISNILYRLIDLKILDYVQNQPSKFVVMVGANDIETTKEDIMVDGVLQIIQIIRKKSPSCQITLFGMYPRLSQKIGEDVMYQRVLKFNEKLKEYCQKENIDYHYFGDDVVKDGKIQSENFVDLVHFSSEGYSLFAKRLADVLAKSG